MPFDGGFFLQWAGASRTSRAPSYTIASLFLAERRGIPNGEWQ
jgi:hypothetical protein